MKKWALLLGLSAILVVGGALVYRAFAVNANPVVGSVWTWLGPTFGADWMSPAPAGSGGGTCNPIGVVADGTTDVGPALAALLASQGARACVAFPPGKFKFNTTFIHDYSGATYESLTIQGAGADVTELIGPTNASGLVFNLKGPGNSIHVRDLSIVTPSACVGCVGLSVVQTVDSPAGAGGNLQLAGNDITGVSVYGDDRTTIGIYPSGTHYWETGILLEGMSTVNIINTLVQAISPAPHPSIGVHLLGSANRVPIVFNFNTFSAYLMQTGILYDKFVQGVTVNQSNLVGIESCISAPSSGTGLDQLSVTNSSFNCGTAIDLAVFVADVTIVGNTFIVGQGAAGRAPASRFLAINAFGAANLAITGNSFEAYNDLGIPTFAIDLYVPGYAGIVANNAFKNFHGIFFQPGAKGYTIVNNAMTGNITPLGYVAGTVNLGDNRIDIPQDCSSLINLKFGGASTGITYGQKFCQFSQQGQEVIIDLRMDLTSKGTATGTATLGPLPLAASNFNPASSMVWSYVEALNIAAGGGSALTGLILPTTSELTFFANVGNNSQGITEGAFTNTSKFVGRITYRVDYR